MKQAAVLSAVFHLLLIIMMVFGLPLAKTPDFEIVNAIPVELLTMAEIAQAPSPSSIPTVQKTDKITPAKSAPKVLPPESLPVPKPLPEPEPIKPLPQPVPPVEAPKPVESVAPVIKPVPQPKKPEPKPDLKQDFEALQSIVNELTADTALIKAQEMVAELDPKPKVEKVQPKPVVKETVTPEKPAVKPVEKPRVKPATEKPKDDNKDKKAEGSFNSVLKNIAKLKPVEQNNGSDDSQPAASHSSHTNQMGPALTDSESNAVRQQIESAWSINPGARNIEQMVITLEIWVNPDRTVRDVKVIQNPEFAGNPFYRSLCESAVRAVRDPRCNPLRLPANQYERWQHIKLNFRPPV